MSLLQQVKKSLVTGAEVAIRGKKITKETTAYAWNNHRKKTIVGVLIVGLILFGIIKNSEDTFTNPYTVATGDVVDQVLLSGRTESVSSVDLGFADSGRVGRVFVTEGQQVQKGQVLAELEMGDLSAQLTSARAGLTIANANLNQANNNVEKVTKEQDVLVEKAKRALFGSLEAYPEDEFSDAEAPTIYGSYQGDTEGVYTLDIYASAAETGASVRFSGLEQGTTPVTFDNRVSLGTKGLFIQFSEDSNYTNTTWEIPIPNNRSSEYAGLKNAYEAAIATRERTIADARADVTGDMASVLQARVDQARAEVDQIISAMNRRKIIAPFSGTISQVALKEGESTIGISKETSPGVSMLATDQYKVVIKIPEIDVARVAPNTPVAITLDAYGKDQIFNGLLTTINPAETIVDGVPVYEGTVIFNEKDERVRSGMTATVSIVIGEKKDVLLIPGNYIREDRVLRKYFVQVVNPDNPKKAQEREITVGVHGSDGMTQVISGLSTGDQIVIKVE